MLKIISGQFSAGLWTKSAKRNVAQVSNRQHVLQPSALCKFKARAGWKHCDTAGWKPALRLCPWPCNAASLEPIRSHRSFSAGHRRSRGEIRNPKLQIRNKQKIQKKKIPKPVPGPWKE